MHDTMQDVQYFVAQVAGDTDVGHHVYKHFCKYEFDRTATYLRLRFTKDVDLGMLREWCSCCMEQLWYHEDYKCDRDAVQAYIKGAPKPRVQHIPPPTEYVFRGLQRGQIPLLRHAISQLRNKACTLNQYWLGRDPKRAAPLCAKVNRQAAAALVTKTELDINGQRVTFEPFDKSRLRPRLYEWCTKCQKTHKGKCHASQHTCGYCTRPHKTDNCHHKNNPKKWRCVICKVNGHRAHTKQCPRTVAHCKKHNLQLPGRKRQQHRTKASLTSSRPYSVGRSYKATAQKQTRKQTQPKPKAARAQQAHGQSAKPRRPHVQPDLMNPDGPDYRRLNKMFIRCVSDFFKSRGDDSRTSSHRSGRRRRSGKPGKGQAQQNPHGRQ